MQKIQLILNTRGMVALLLVAKGAGEAIWRLTSNSDTASNAPDIWSGLWEITSSWWGVVILLLLGFAWIAYLITQPKWVPNALRWVLLGSNKQNEFQDETTGRLDAIEAKLTPVVNDQARWEAVERNLTNLTNSFAEYRSVMSKRSLSGNDAWLKELESAIDNLSPVDTHPDHPLYDIRIDLTKTDLVSTTMQTVIRARFEVKNGTEYPIRLTGLTGGTLSMNAIDLYGGQFTVQSVKAGPRKHVTTTVDVPLSEKQEVERAKSGLLIKFEKASVQIEAQRVNGRVWDELGWRTLNGESNVASD